MKKVWLICLLLMASTMMLCAKNIVKVYVTTNPRMHCESCEKKIRKALQFERGMKDMQFDIENNTILLVFDEDKTSLEKLGEKLQKIGYEIEIVAPENLPQENHDPNDNCCGHASQSSCITVKKK